MFRYDLVWNKVLTTGFLNAKRMPLRQHEQIAIFYKKLPTYNPQMTTGKPLHGMGKSYKTVERTNQNYGHFSAIDDIKLSVIVREDNDEYINDNALTVNISRLRSKLEGFGYPDAIETRKGQGYILL